MSPSKVYFWNDLSADHSYCHLCHFHPGCYGFANFWCVKISLSGYQKRLVEFRFRCSQTALSQNKKRDKEKCSNRKWSGCVPASLLCLEPHARASTASWMTYSMVKKALDESIPWWFSCGWSTPWWFFCGWNILWLIFWVHSIACKICKPHDKLSAT